MSRILVIDDDFHCRSLLLRFLQTADLYACEAANAGEGFKAVESRRPNVVILDWRLKDGVAGPGFMKTLRRHHLSLPVVMMTSTRCDERDELAALRHGANLFFEKQEIFDNIDAFLRHVKALALASPGEDPGDGGVYELAGLRLAPRTGRAQVGGKDVELNPKESELLAVLLRRPGVLHSASALWSAVWAEDPAGDWHHTLDNRVSSLRRKLGPKWGSRLVSRKGQGYLLDVL